MKKQNHVRNAADDNAKSPNDTASPDSLIYSKLKRKIDPRSMIKLKKVKNKVTDVDTEEKNASNYLMNTGPHAPNTVTAPDIDNKMSVRQLLDGQEYPVKKVILLRRGFITKLLLSNSWTISMTYPNLLAVLGIPMIELHRDPSYKFFLLKTRLCWEERN